MPGLKAEIQRLTGWRRHGFAFLLGAFGALALPPVHVVPALVPALAGLIWLVEATGRARHAAGVGWSWGFGFFVAGLYWVGIAFFNDSRGYEWLAPLGVAGLAAINAAFPAAVAAMLRLVGGRGPGRVLVFAAAWTLLEWVRSWILTGFPWNLLGSVWAFGDAMIQPAAWMGTYGLSLVTVTAAAMPAILSEEGWKGWAGRTVVGLALVLPLALGAAGAVRLARAPDADVPDVRLRLVQPNIPQKDKWKRELRGHHVFEQVEMSRAKADPPPTLVIWGETMVPFFLADDPKVMKAVSLAAPEGGLAIVGAPRVSGETPRRVYNSLHVLDRQGAMLATHDKVHLVPFGEYVPLRGLLPIGKLAQGAGGDFSPGPGLTTLHVPGLPPFSPLICYEVIFPGAVLDPADRPKWLLNLTNDSWYGRSSGPYQHFVASRLRAVEEGLPLVRVANGGISGVVDAYGRARSLLPLGESGIADSPLPATPAGITPYGRYGNWIPLLLVFAWASIGMFTYGKNQKPPS